MMVELICSRIDVASIVWVLSSLLRLFVAMEPTISPIMLSEPITMMAPAIINSIIEIPACEFLRVFLRIIIITFTGCALLLEVSRYRAHAPRGLAFAAAHSFTGCALSGLHSQPLINQSRLRRSRTIA
jgi:hypothetical protein